MLADGVRWFDDWFALENIAPDIIAIGEPRFHYDNWNYLIIGETSALMFDSGTGVRDIRPTIRALTDKPVTVLPSHMHFDHTGNLHLFDNIALPDLPVLRACDQNGVFNCPEDLFLGSWANMIWQPCQINHWWPIGQEIDLGGRKLQLLHTPGHSPDSIALWDAKADIMLVADYIYPGSLYAQVPGSSLAAYEKTADTLLQQLSKKTKLFAAHGTANGNHRAPLMQKHDVADLRASLVSLRKSGKKPATWPVNEQVSLLLAPHSFDAWQNGS